MLGTKANEKLFWNSRAAAYPLPFEPGTLSRTERILRLLARMGAELGGRRILDIGCGTGIYSLPLASRGGSVLGVDSSPAMLRVFRRERHERGIKNASYLLSSWCDLPAVRIAGRFDVALASMTMAIKDAADLVKMEKAALERCVYIGWAGVRRNELMEAVYHGHALKYKAPSGAEAVLPALRAMGRRPSVRIISDSWTKILSPGAALDEIEIGMRVNGVKMRKRWTAELIKEFTADGQVRQLTRVKKALITWRP